MEKVEKLQKIIKEIKLLKSGDIINPENLNTPLLDIVKNVQEVFDSQQPYFDKLDNIEANAQVNVQSDWTNTDSKSDSFIKNKPILGSMSSKNASDYKTHVQNEGIFVKQESNKQLISKEDQDKLDNIEANAQVNVQSDWTNTDSKSDSFIKNKPILGSMSSKNASDYKTHVQNEGIFVKQESNKQLSTEDFSTNHKVKLDRISVSNNIDLDEIKSSLDSLSTAVVLKGKWDPETGKFPEGAKAGWSYIVIGDADVDGIEFRNGDRLLAIGTDPSTTTYAENWLKQDYTDRINTVAGRTGDIILNMGDIEDIGTMAGEDVSDYRTNAENEKIFVKIGEGVALIPQEDLDHINSVEFGAQKNVQSNWNETNPNLDSFIQNKPLIATQTEAEEGSSNSIKLWSPLRIVQLVNSWWNKSASKTKLDRIADGATKNSTDAELRNRTTHTGTQSISTISGLQTSLDSKVDNNDTRLTNSREWTASVVTQAEAEAGVATTARKWTAQRVRQAIASWWASTNNQAKLDGIQSGATKNATDAELRNRTTHTGTQSISTISGLQTSLDSKVDNNDTRLTNSREWIGATISQAEAEAGTSSTRRAFTAQRVRQAIESWWLTASTVFGRSLISSDDASEAKSKLGLSSIATSGSYNDLSNKPVIPEIPTLMSQAEANTGTATTQRTINAKVLKDTIDTSLTTATKLLQHKLTAGANVQISPDNVISATNTTYTGMTPEEIDVGTSTENRSISSKVLNDWLSGKGYSTQTLVAGNNISISGNTISAVNTTYTGMSQAEANAGSSTTHRLISPKVLVDTISAAVSGGVSADALIKANNLSDLPNKDTARTNLGLGTVATRDVGTGPGNVMEVGAFGLGVSLPNSDLPTIESPTGFYNNGTYTVVHAQRNSQYGFQIRNRGRTNQFDFVSFDHNVEDEGGVLSVDTIYHSGNFNPASKANTSTQVIAGNGLSGGGTLAANRTITLGTPSTLTSSTTNAVTATSHTHEIVVTKADVGLGDVLNVASYSKTESDARYYTQTTADSRYAYKAGTATQDFSAKDATVTKLKFGTSAEMVYNDSSKSIDFIFS